MLTGELRSKIDRVWDAFWTGGISNPLTVIEQITYLLFIKRLDELQTAKESQANRLGQEVTHPIFPSDKNELRWSFFKNMDAGEMYKTVAEKVFPFIKTMNGDSQSSYAKYMKDAVFIIPTPNLLEKVVTMISSIPMEDRDTKGDVYEYLLSKISTAGQNGQFRTPRHIIKMMVELIKPKPTDTICDPACGTAGFLVATSEYLRDNYKTQTWSTEEWKHYNNAMFYGNDFDITMIRIAVMNMMLHGIENPNITSHDALSELNMDNEEAYDVILANPPFKGSLDYEVVANDLLATVKTKKTELLFLALMLRMLKIGGRCAVIVPDGVLFGSSKAHRDIRKKIIESNKLDAVVSMPSGVFKPYAGVSTAILIFTKTNSGGTDKVWFYDMQADGFGLNDQRTPLDQSKHENNNIPDVVERFNNLTGEETRSPIEQSFFVSLKDIREFDYDLSINKYKKSEQKVVKYEKPEVIIEQLLNLELSISEGLTDIKKLIKK